MRWREGAGEWEGGGAESIVEKGGFDQQSGSIDEADVSVRRPVETHSGSLSRALFHIPVLRRQPVKYVAGEIPGAALKAGFGILRRIGATKPRSCADWE